MIEDEKDTCHSAKEACDQIAEILVEPNVVSKGSHAGFTLFDANETAAERGSDNAVNDKKACEEDNKDKIVVIRNIPQRPWPKVRP